MSNPIIVILEGIDGSGKSTLAQRVHDHLKGSRIYRDPGGTNAGEAIRKLVKSAEVPMHPNTQFLLFCAARAELTIQVNEDLAAGRSVVLDRWWYSTYAYQGASGIAELPIIDIADNFSSLSFPAIGDDDGLLEGGRLMSYHLHVSPETARKRMFLLDRMNDVVKDRYESKPPSFLDAVYERYIELERRGYLSRVETEGRDIETVWLDLRERVEEQLAKYG